MATNEEAEEFQSHFKSVKVFRSDCLGSGAYGMVCKAECDQLPCAAKWLHHTFATMGRTWVTDKFLQECAFLSSIKHPNIVQFLGVHRDPSSGQPVLLMELMDESLTHFLNSFGPDETVSLHTQVDISHDVVLALHYLHSNGIIHRDLSSNNVLLIAGKRAKITDFGMSKLTTTTSVPLSSYTQVPGCPVYMPPEAWLSPPVYTETLDIFSFGVLLLQIITKNSPSPGPSEVLISDKRSPTGFLKLPVSEKDRRGPDIDLVSSEHPLREDLLKCLLDKGDERPSAEQLCLLISDIKGSTSYQESLSSQGGAEISSSTDDTVSQKESLDDSRTAKLEASYKQLLEEKTNEVKQLQLKVTNLQSHVTDLEDEVSMKNSQIVQLKSELKSKGKHSQQRQPFHKKAVVLNGFSPEVLAVIAKNRDITVYHIQYDLESGSVAFFVDKEHEEVSQNIRVFLLIYKHVFNSGQLRMDFIPIPSSFPMQFLDKCMKLCRMDHRKTTFQHIEEAKMVKVISQTPEQLMLSSQQLTDCLNLTVTLPGSGNRKLIVKYGDIIEEEVSIIVSAASPDLTHRWGVAAAINVASGFEVQKQTEEYIEKHGFLLPGNVACTKAGGTLKCDWIIHAVGTSGVFKGESHDPKLAKEVDDLLKQLVARILHKAETLQATSIAIPAISTGSMALDCNVAASAIIEGVIEHKFKPQSSLSTIRLVMLKDDVFKVFAEVLIDRSSLVYSKVLQNLSDKGATGASKTSITNNPYTDHAPNSCKHQ